MRRSGRNTIPALRRSWLFFSISCLAVMAGCAKTEPPAETPRSESPPASDNQDSGVEKADAREVATESPSVTTSQVTVTISGLLSDTGWVMCGLFADEKSFNEKEAPIREVRLKSEGGSCECVFQDVPLGTYAVAVFHDANENGRLDTNVVGVPTESYGFSTNPTSKFGPPGYRDAEFTVDRQEVHLSIHMR